jgi:EAL domain-containing protein (putative c-di-GMP-specific phosphodiesterase class I)
VRTIVDLGQAYGLEVIAEGIEDAGQLLTLVDKGCILGQGYHLGRPTEPEVLLMTLADFETRHTIADAAESTLAPWPTRDDAA